MMLINEFVKKWHSIPAELNVFQNVEMGSRFKMYIGRNSENRKEFRILTNYEPGHIENSNKFTVRTFRESNFWNISIILLNEGFNEVFVLLLWDLYECAQKSFDEREAVSHISKRIHKWRMLFENLSSIMSDEKIRGLLGELFYLREFMFPLTHSFGTIDTWRGPLGEDQDFFYKESWYEVKSVRYGSEKVKISSVEQLDCDANGTFIIVEMDEGSQEDSRSISLPEIIQSIEKIIRGNDLEEIEFARRLMQYGYRYSQEYNDKRYIIKRLREYNVDSDFPRVTRKSIRKEIVNLEYYLSIPALENWIKGIPYEY